MIDLITGRLYKMDEQRYNSVVNQFSLQGDSPFNKYEMLAKVANAAPEGILVEIGFRAGTGVMSMIEGNTHSDKNLYVAIDPFGNIPFKEGNNTRTHDYTNARRKGTLNNFYNYLSDLNTTTNFIFFNLESVEFFGRYADGIPDYFSGEKRIRTDYAVAHLDGQHDTDTVLKEVQFFIPRIQPNGFIVIDNTERGWMDMDVIEKELSNGGFVKHEFTVSDKWGYIKKV
jgi:hypothetical protein